MPGTPGRAWERRFEEYWAKGQRKEVNVNTAVIGSKASVAGSEIRVTPHAGSGDFETEVRPFVLDAINYANEKA
jgi:hypothetical protein